MKKNYALFSTNGRFIGFTNFKPTNGLYKEMPDNFDPVTQVYVGDYKTGGLKDVESLEQKDYREANIDKKWKIFESDLDKELELNIVKGHKLPLYKQLNLIMEVIDKNKDKLELTEEFKQMFETIARLRHNHKNSLKTYEEAPKAQVIYKDQENQYIEEYTKKQLSIHETEVSKNK
jgi:hypothetical protein